MFSRDKFDMLLQAYKEDFLEKTWPEEKYKWMAVQHFQEHWDLDRDDFLEMFLLATEKTENLLASMHYYPRGMIKEFCQVDEESVKAMFIKLYDETLPLLNRIESFRAEADRLKDTYGQESWNEHYQHANAISTYLWLRYPDQYYIYKYSESRALCRAIDSSFRPKKGAFSRNMIGAFELYDMLSTLLLEDAALIEGFQSVLDSTCYPDPLAHTLMVDLTYYSKHRYSDRKTAESSWYHPGYSPGITKNQWLKLLGDPTVFDASSHVIMHRFLENGGQGTCKELSKRFGESMYFYKNGSTGIAKRVYEMTECELLQVGHLPVDWWAILFHGRPAEKEEEGTFLWKLREELKEALAEYTPQDSQGEVNKEMLEKERNYWWLTASPKQWSFSSLDIGDNQFYTKRNENGNKRRIYQNFLDAKEGDYLIGYESNPVKAIVALGRIVGQDEDNLYFEKTENILSPIDFSTLKAFEELKSMEFFQNPNGSLFKLTKDEYDFLLDRIRDENP